MEIYITSRNTGKNYTAQVIFARNTKAQILNHVIGTVHTYLDNDTLLIKIFGANNIVFTYEMKNLSHAIVHGFTSERLAQIVVKRYTQYIKSLYFL